MNFITDLERLTLEAGDRLAAVIDHPDKRLVLIYRDGELFGWSEAANLALRLAKSPIRLRLGSGEWIGPA